MEGANVNDGMRALITSEIIRKRDSLQSIFDAGGEDHFRQLVCCAREM
jgi:hypothetical protein